MSNRIQTYRLLSFDSRDERNATFARFLNHDDFRRLAYPHPEPLGSSFPTPQLRLDAEECGPGAPCDYFDVGSMPIVSEELLRLLEPVSEWEIYEVELYNRDGSPYTDKRYFFPHLIKKLSCIDYERSDYTYDERFDRVDELRSVVLDHDRIGDAVLFDADESALPPWVVRDDFARHLEQTGLTGFLFRDINEYVRLLFGGRRR